jgi:hypothetical protein
MADIFLEKSRRKILLINKKFQLRIMFYFIITGILIALIFILGQLYFIRNLLQLGYSIGLPGNHPYFIFISKQSDKVLLISSVSSVLALLVISISSLYLGHHIAGPMYNLSNWFRKLGEQTSKVTPLKFRKGDYFDEIPEIINKALKEKNLIE